MGKLEEVIKGIKPLDEAAMAQARSHQDRLTKPQGSLGRLEELSVKLAGITGLAVPQIRHKVVITMAGDHGVVEEGVSAYPQEVTRQMVYNFLRGGAGINVLARYARARVVVVDMGVKGELERNPALVDKKVAHGTANLARGPAMSREDALRAVERGIVVVDQEWAKGMDIVATGDMGIGNTTPSSAIVAAITGEDVEKVTGRGTGIDDAQRQLKIRVIQKALALHSIDPKDPLDVLAKVGGFEIGGLAGVMLGAASHRVPIIVDGFISGAAALIAAGLCHRLKDYLIAGHKSAEAGHEAALRWLGLEPLLDLNMRLGEGTGAVLAMMLVEASVRVLGEMATFGEAGVSERSAE